MFPLIMLANQPSQDPDMALAHEYGHRLNDFGYGIAPQASPYSIDTPRSDTSQSQLYEELKAWRHGLRMLHSFYQSKGYPDAMERTLKHMPQAYSAYDTYLQHAGARQTAPTSQTPYLNVYSDKTQTLPFSTTNVAQLPAVPAYAGVGIAGGIGGAGLSIPVTGIVRNLQMRKNLPVNPRVLRSFGKGGLAGGLIGALAAAGYTYLGRNNNNMHLPGQKLLPQDERMVRGPREMAKFVFPYLQGDEKTLESIGKAEPLQSDFFSGRAPFEVNRFTMHN